MAPLTQSNPPPPDREANRAAAAALKAKLLHGIGKRTRDASEPSSSEAEVHNPASEVQEDTPVEEPPMKARKLENGGVSRSLARDSLLNSHNDVLSS